MPYSELWVFLVFSGVLLATDRSANENKTVEAFIDMVLNNLTACANYNWPINNEKLIHVDRSNEEKIYDFGTFDFVIVGAGSAGSLLANRLTEIKKWKVLLLEAGGPENEFSDIPGMATNLILTDMNWGYLSSPQERACKGMDKRRCIVPRGRVIGGSSIINAKMYTRGNKGDYDEWEAMGNLGWSYKDVLPYFKKTEQSNIPDGDPGFHGKGGLLNVNYSHPTIFTPVIFNGLRELGSKLVDYNGKNQIGAFKIQSTIKRNKIASAGRSFIDPFLNRTNLNVTMNAFVTKLIINKQNRTAVGLIFIKSGKKYKVRARKEVILSAGAVNTPQILMLSGIGPKDELKKIGVDTLVDLPVGKAMQDHVAFMGINFRTNVTLFNDSVQVLLKEYLNNRGPYTRAYGADAGSFFNTNDNKSSVPDIQQLFAVPHGPDPLAPKYYNFAKDMKFLIDPYTDILVIMALLHPKSRGSVTLKSKDPRDFPIVNCNIYDVAEDKDTMYKGIKTTLKLLETNAFKSINTTYSPATSVCLNHTELSKEYWYCLMEYFSSSFYHLSGTTKMGVSRNDSVVTPKLIVHGLKNLRVVDAGVIPKVPSGNTNAPTYMIAEKAADFIKNHHSRCT